MVMINLAMIYISLLSSCHLQAILLIREHEASYNALCLALEQGKGVGDSILAIEDNLPLELPSKKRIADRANRKKMMESDLVMRYVQKLTWKVGGIESVEYEGDMIKGANPHEAPVKGMYAKSYIEIRKITQLMQQSRVRS